MKYPIIAMMLMVSFYGGMIVGWLLTLQKPEENLSKKKKLPPSWR